MKPSDSQSMSNQILYGATNWALFLAGLTNLGVGTWCAMKLEVAASATSLTAGLVLLFAATIDRFESLKGLGIEAKTRQLDQKIEEAGEALRRLKELTEFTSRVLVDHNSKLGRVGGAPSPKEAYALAQSVRATLEALGSDQSTIRATLKPWVGMMLFDITAALIKPIRKAVREKTMEVENKKSSTPYLTTDDPAFIQMTAQVKEGNEYLGDRLRRVDTFEIEDFPNRLLQLVDDAPLLSRVAVEEHKARVSKFTTAMPSLITEMRLPDPELWFNAIDADRTGQS